MKTCRECQEEKPLEHFHRNRTRKTDGHHDHCKVCRSWTRKYGRRQSRQRLILQQAAMLSRRLPSWLPAGKLAGAGVWALGGAEGFATELAAAFHDAPRGSRQRTSIMVAMVRFVIEASRRGEAEFEAEAEDPDLIRDEDLLRHRKELIKRMLAAGELTLDGDFVGDDEDSG